MPEYRQLLDLSIALHFFGPRYVLPMSLALYLYGAAGILVVAFALVSVLGADRTGAKALQYSRWKAPFLVPIARSPIPRLVGGAVGVLGLTAVIVTGFLGSTDPTRNPAEYLTWIYFWTATLIASALVGNLWFLLNPPLAIYNMLSRLARLGPVWKLPAVGVWPALAAYFAFSCLELTSGMANQPRLVAGAALAYTAITLIGMTVFGRDDWLAHCDPFTVIFDIVGRLSPVEAERDGEGRVTVVYLRAWGVGLLRPAPVGWDRVLFVMLMLSTVAFDATIATPSWQDFTIATEPYWLPLGPFGFFLNRTFGFLLITIGFLLIFHAFIQLVVYFGTRKVDLNTTLAAFALTLVPIAIVYDAAHNWGSLLVQSQSLIPLLNDPLAKGWQLWPAVANYQPSFALAQPSTVWYAQVVLIVIGAVIALYLSHLRAGERFRTAQRALLSQYPILLLMVLYAMFSLWILAQPVTTGG
jgi:hypothetical protein